MAKRTVRRSSTPKGPAKKAASARKPAASATSGSRRKPVAAAGRKKAAPKTAAAKKRASATPARRTVKKAKKPAASARGGSPRALKTAKPAPARAKARTPAKVAGKAAAPKAAPAPVKTRKKAAPHRTSTPRPDPVVQTPPSSLNMNRRGSAVRTGRAELAESRAEHANLTPSITGGDVDANVEDAYFTGDEAPGGDNPTPDQDIVDDIGKALGVEYQDNEELRGADKLSDRDKHRWELDPASSEDYRDRR